MTLKKPSPKDISQRFISQTTDPPNLRLCSRRAMWNWWTSRNSLENFTTTTSWAITPRYWAAIRFAIALTCPRLTQPTFSIAGKISNHRLLCFCNGVCPIRRFIGTCRLHRNPRVVLQENLRPAQLSFRLHASEKSRPSRSQTRKYSRLCLRLFKVSSEIFRRVSSFI